MKRQQNAKNGSDNKQMQHKKMARKVNSNFRAVKISLILSAVLTPLVLIAVTYLVINSDFGGFIHMKWGRDGGEVLIDQRRPAFPNSEN